MATRANAVAVRAASKSRPLLVPDSSVLPATFLDALKDGWQFTYETTLLAIDKRHRDGTVTLTKPGFAKLFVPYTATVKQGYIFGKPRLA